MLFIFLTSMYTIMCNIVNLNYPIQQVQQEIYQLLKRKDTIEDKVHKLYNPSLQSEK